MDEALRIVSVLWLLGGVGITLLLAELPWFARLSLTQRLTPYSGNGSRSNNYLSLRDVLLPAFSSVADRLARSLGVGTDTAARLRRSGFQGDIASFRVRQLGAAVLGLGVGLLATITLGPPPALVILTLMAPMFLGVLIIEQQVVKAAQQRQRDVFTELPLIAEQLAMLLGAGHSVGSAVARVAERSSGTSALDLLEVAERVRQGLPIVHALREWADLIAIPELHRLVDVLALGNDTSNLGALVSNEAKTFRAEAHRRLIEHMEKRAQQVWVPVTVATLVPGVIFLAIPFLQALEMFSGT